MGMGLELEVLELSFHAHGRELRSHLIPGEKKKIPARAGKEMEEQEKARRVFLGKNCSLAFAVFQQHCRFPGRKDQKDSWEVGRKFPG